MIKKLTLNVNNFESNGVAFNTKPDTLLAFKKTLSNEENYKPKKNYTLSKYQKTSFGLSSYPGKR